MKNGASIKLISKNKQKNELSSKKKNKVNIYKIEEKRKVVEDTYSLK